MDIHKLVRTIPAASRYAELAARTLDEDSLRTIDVKAGCSATRGLAGRWQHISVGTPERGVDGVNAGALLGAWIGEVILPRLTRVSAGEGFQAP